ncbi:MAG: extradiol dioxygenase [Acidobacteriota bacterium]|nr:extradiol dioxygenase [Acidobacteriota bacterium]
MAKEIWLNLPVKDVGKSKEFFGKLGFAFNEKYTSDEMACMLIGEKNFQVLLFPEKTFKGFTRSEVSDAGQTAECLISLDAASREEVDEMAKKAWEAGARVFAEPDEIQGWMYGFAFADLDGHRWNVVHMDFSKMPD